MSRAQLKHVLLDVSFKDKPKIIDLEVEFKPIARLLLMDILAACSAASNAEITVNVCKHLGNRIGIEAESVEKILDYCVKYDILFSVNGKITNSRVIKDQESYFNKLESDRKRKESKRNPSGNNKDPDIDFDIDIDNETDLNSLELEIALPEFQNTETSTAIVRWARHQKKLGRGFDQGGVDSMLSLYRSSPRDLAIDIDHSILNGWKTLNAKSRDAPRKEKKSTKDTIRELYEEALLEEQNAKN
jgi:hypothetical protein